MPPKTAKKQVGPRKKQGSLRKKVVNPRPCAPVTTATLDIAAHPSIFSNIISFCSPKTLAILLRCNKSTFQLTVGRLYRNLRVTQPGLNRLIETGQAPSKRGSTSGLLGRGVSPYLKEASSKVNSLILKTLGWDDHSPSPIPRGCFERIEQLVLEPDRADRRCAIPRWARSIKPRTLVTRHTAHSHLAILGHDIPDGVEHLVVLISNAADIRTFEQISLHTNWRKNERLAKCAVSLVFLPGPYTSLAYYDFGPPNEPSHELTYSPPASTSESPIRLVGCELFNTGETRVQDHMLKQMAQEGRSEEDKASLTFMRFEDWLDEQEPGSIFDGNEENQWRKIDKEIRSGRLTW